MKHTETMPLADLAAAVDEAFSHQRKCERIAYPCDHTAKWWRVDPCCHKVRAVCDDHALHGHNPASPVVICRRCGRAYPKSAIRLEPIQ